MSYQGRLHLLAEDEHDAYWIMRHRVVQNWTPLDALARDEEAVAACRAWERYYIGMEIAGTIHNEMRLPPGTPAEADLTSLPAGEADQERGGVPQHEGSGGGRSIPQHRRMYARVTEPEDGQPVVRRSAPGFAHLDPPLPGRDRPGGSSTGLGGPGGVEPGGRRLPLTVAVHLR